MVADCDTNAAALVALSPKVCDFDFDFDFEIGFLSYRSILHVVFQISLALEPLRNFVEKMPFA